MSESAKRWRWPMSIETVSYSHVEDKDSETSWESEETVIPSRKTRWSIRALWIMNAVQSALIAVLFVSYHLAASRRPSDAECAVQLSPYSPYLETGDVEYLQFMDDNGLYEPSPYKGYPSPELDKAWQGLFAIPLVGFPDEKMYALNKTPAENWVHVDPKYGDGVLGYLNVFHQLHCLNLVRQYTYRNDYDYSNAMGFHQQPNFLRLHVDHCIEAVRRSLMCAADVTPLVYVANASEPFGYDADFAMTRKCKNWDKIRSWAEERLVQAPSKEDLAQGL